MPKKAKMPRLLKKIGGLKKVGFKGIPKGGLFAPKLRKFKKLV